MLGRLDGAQVGSSGRGAKPQVQPTNPNAVNEFYNGLLKCLNRGWPAAIAAAGYEFHQPAMAVVFATFNTPCGKSAPYVSFYCSSDETIYLRGDEILISNRDYGPIGASWWASHVGTHEYGHYVQQLTGMMTAYQNLYAAAPDQAAKDQLERRLELQASCLGHVFLTANRRTYPITAQMRSDWGWQIIKIPNHGSEANQRYWINRAVQLKRPGACNTWAAPAAQVS
ncbi:neutral zinc metallopeptidase [Kribbella sp. NPDC059898]|uniref:neutral zinc metallopeptidase n=1 Tax=Kribbella sp. NPDC059898 TaxID=3346995 RepID=UPI0036636400